MPHCHLLTGKSTPMSRILCPKVLDDSLSAFPLAILKNKLIFVQPNTDTLPSLQTLPVAPVLDHLSLSRCEYHITLPVSAGGELVMQELTQRLEMVPTLPGQPAHHHHHLPIGREEVSELLTGCLTT